MVEDGGIELYDGEKGWRRRAEGEERIYPR